MSDGDISFSPSRDLIFRQHLRGVEVIERIRMETPHARFIVLTTYDGDEDIYRALQAGARAYLLKGMTSEELIADHSRGSCGQVAHSAGDCASGWPSAWAPRS